MQNKVSTLLKTCLRMNTHRNFQFIQRLNPIANIMEWKVVDDDYDYNQEIATSSYADMLHDDERNKKFGAALKRAIIEIHNRGKKAHVLDIGTGTGLLSMLAVRYGADTVVACEAFLPMAGCAINIIKQNHCYGKIKVVKKHSTALTVGAEGDLQHKANILVSEVFDTELIGEGAIRTFNHAHEHLMEEDCIVIPSAATVYAQVVECSLAEKWNKLEDWNQSGKVFVKIPKEIQDCTGAAAVHDIQLSQLPQDMFTPLSPVIPVLRFDWSGGGTGINATKRQTVEHFVASATGTAHVVLMWWDLVMDTEGDIIVSCAPVWAHPDRPTSPTRSANQGNPAANIPWRDHWMQAVYFLTQTSTVDTGATYQLITNHDEFSLWFQISPEDDSAALTVPARPVCTCGFHMMLSRTRVGAMNDPRRRDLYMKVLRSTIKPMSVCVFFGDVSLLAVLAVKLGAKHVFCVDQNTNSQDVIKRIGQFNNIDKEITVCNDVSQVLNNLRNLSQTEKEFAESLKSIVVLSEPFFRNTIVPWDSIHVWYQVQELVNLCGACTGVQAGLTFPIYPKRCLIRACPMQFDDLWKINTRLRSCEGFDMTLFDELIDAAKEKAESYTEAQPLWEYPGRALAPPATLFDFNLAGTLPTVPVSAEGRWEFPVSCRCDGVALWVEYEYGEERLSFGPIRSPGVGDYVKWDMNERQGVHLFRETRQVDKGLYLKYQAEFQPLCAEFGFSFNF